MTTVKVRSVRSRPWVRHHRIDRVNVRPVTVNEGDEFDALPRDVERWTRAGWVEKVATPKKTAARTGGD